MTDLCFVCVSDDGDRLIMRDPQGEEYALTLDNEVLRAITVSRRRPAARPAAAPAPSADGGPVTPAEVQRLLRHGADLESVASQSGMDVETVRSFAVPVLQERAFVADQAGKCLVPVGGTLVEAVTQRLSSRGITDDIRWDAWRRSDGMWTVLVGFPEDGATLPMSEETGTWLYDPKTRSVTAEDDTARWLTNMPSTPEPEPDKVIIIEDADSPGSSPSTSPTVETIARRPAPAAVDGQLSFVDEPEVIDVTTPAPRSEPVRVAAAPQPVQPTGKPLSRRAARRQAAKRRADRREPTWDEILFGVSRSDDPTI